MHSKLSSKIRWAQQSGRKLLRGRILSCFGIDVVASGPVGLPLPSHDRDDSRSPANELRQEPMSA